MFTPTEEQQMLIDMMGKFAEKEIAPNILQWEEEGKFARHIFDKLGELGFCGMTITEEYGGGGLGYMTYAMVLEEGAIKTGGGLGFLPLHLAAATPIEAFGTKEQKEKYLTKMTAGKALGAFALTEPNAGSDAAAIMTSAVLRGDRYVLNGAKSFITNAGEAELYLVMAKTDKDKGANGISSFIVEKDAPGFIVGQKEKKMGLNYISTRGLTFEECEVPLANRVGEENKGFLSAMYALDGSRIGVAASATGISQAALNAAVSYAKQRYAFGQPIANFQIIQFMLADMETETVASRMLAYRAASMKDEGKKIAAAAAMAKRYATDTAMRVTTNAVQILGGYGYMKEYTVERYMREAKLLQIVEGTSQIQGLVVARELLK
ncbi:Acyl-CoA dehydrogenase [uncultured Desulfobacterium sp.]|uniref:Cyclohex-1-ene-1-carbonyl-CoA dehydrogenase n=1 Tax=uncultured Desulfobacterium sp. TaxID=201089 RepID=A0A445MYF1_9BACT|nr:Acyl-CoA dehydrogenase [uncultured Desulfobacterium sp.]